MYIHYTRTISTTPTITCVWCHNTIPIVGTVITKCSYCGHVIQAISYQHISNIILESRTVEVTGGSDKYASRVQLLCMSYRHIKSSPIMVGHNTFVRADSIFILHQTQSVVRLRLDSESSSLTAVRLRTLQLGEMFHVKHTAPKSNNKIANKRKGDLLWQEHVMYTEQFYQQKLRL